MRATLRADTRPNHVRMWEFVRHEIALVPGGDRLLRHRSDRRKAPKVIGGAGDARRPATRDVVLGNVRMLAHEIAHVLRVGPDGPLMPPGPWRPRDGDWLHVAPSNWQRVDTTKPRGTAGREAAARARTAAMAAGLALRSSIVGCYWYPGGRLETARDPRYWWVRAVTVWGDTVPDLSVPWEQARALAPRYWALAQHLAHRARSAPPASDKAAEPLIRELNAEMRATVTDAQRWAAVVTWATAAARRGELFDAPGQAQALYEAARQDAAPISAPATPAEDDNDNELF